MGLNWLLVRGLITVGLLLVSTVQIKSYVSFHCDRTPKDNVHFKSSSDGNFGLKIKGDPKQYIPGQQYYGNFRPDLKFYLFRLPELYVSELYQQYCHSLIQQQIW